MAGGAAGAGGSGVEAVTGVASHETYMSVHKMGQTSSPMILVLLMIHGMLTVSVGLEILDKDNVHGNNRTPRLIS